MDTHSCTAASCAVGCGVHCAILSGVQTISFVVSRQPCWLSPCICKLVAAAEDLRANMHRAHSVPFGGVVVLASPCVYFAFAFLVVRLAPCSLHQGASLQTCTVLIACLLGVLDGCVCFTRCVPCPCYASSSPSSCPLHQGSSYSTPMIQFLILWNVWLGRLAPASVHYCQQSLLHFDRRHGVLCLSCTSHCLCNMYNQ
jgi:hypothetical protein